jgi:hypothetical protein
MLETENKVIALTREELYEKVWSQPMRTLAPTFGLSDVGLKKICHRLKIPTPPLGYWAKKQHGHHVRRPSLPRLNEIKEKAIRFRLATPKEPNRQLTEIEQLIADEKKPGNNIHVSSQLSEPHPLVERTECSLRNTKADQQVLIRPKVKKCLSVSVGIMNIDRAMRIMDALVKALEHRGYVVSPGEERGTTTKVIIREETVEFELKELLNKQQRELTAAQKKEQERYSWLHSRPEYDYSLSGRLALMIGSCAKSGRKKWSDGDKHHVEDYLNSFIAGLIQTSEDIKNERIREDQRKKEREEWERKRREEEQQRWEEERRIKDLEQKLGAWQQSRHIRAFIEAVRENALQKHGNILPDSDLAKWLMWAEARANRIDPITSGQTFATKVSSTWNTYPWS